MAVLLTLPGIESFLIGECRALGLETGPVGDGWVTAAGDPAILQGRAGTLRAVLEPVWTGPAAEMPRSLPAAERIWCEGQWINEGRRCRAAFAAAARAAGGAEVLTRPTGRTDLVCIIDRNGHALVGQAREWGVEMRRPYRLALMSRSLNPAMARALVMASRARPGDHFLDPCCGSGTVLAERGLLGPCRLDGLDVELAAVDAASRTLAGFALQWSRPGAGAGAVEVRQGDARALPHADGDISALATNLPFGHRLGSPAANAELYGPMLREAARVVRPGGRIVLLSGDPRELRRAVRACGSLLRVRSLLRVWLGGLQPCLAVYDRTGSRFDRAS